MAGEFKRVSGRLKNTAEGDGLVPIYLSSSLIIILKSRNPDHIAHYRIGAVETGDQADVK
jgi:hypothetical protein